MKQFNECMTTALSLWAKSPLVRSLKSRNIKIVFPWQEVAAHVQ